MHEKKFPFQKNVSDKYEDFISLNENQSFSNIPSEEENRSKNPEIKEHMTDFELIMLVFKNSFFILWSKFILAFMENLIVIFIGKNDTNTKGIFVISTAIQSFLFDGIGYGIAFASYVLNLKYYMKNNHSAIGQTSNQSVILILVFCCFAFFIPLFCSDSFKIVFSVGTNYIEAVKTLIINGHSMIISQMLVCTFSFYLYSQNNFLFPALFDSLSCGLLLLVFKFFLNSNLIETISDNHNKNVNLSLFSINETLNHIKTSNINNILYLESDALYASLLKNDTNSIDLIKKNITKFKYNIYDPLNYSNLTISEGNFEEQNYINYFFKVAWIINGVYFIQVLFYLIYIYIKRPFPNSIVRVSKETLKRLPKFLKNSIDFILMYFFYSIINGKLNVILNNMIKEESTSEKIGFSIFQIFQGILRSLSIGYFIVIFKIAVKIRRRKFNGFLSRMIKLFFFLSFSVLIIMTIIILFTSNHIANLFTTDDEIKNSMDEIIKIFIFLIIPFHFVNTFLAVLIAYKNKRKTNYILIGITFLIFTPLSIIFLYVLKFNTKGLFITSIITQVILSGILYSFIRKLKNYEEIDEEKFSLIL